MTTLLVLLALVLVSCTPQEPYIDVYYRHAGSSEDLLLESVYISAGKDRHKHYRLAPGQSGKVRLIPGKSVVIPDDRTLYIRYRFETQALEDTLHWEGPQLPQDSSYRISIEIYPDGHVESSFTLKP